MKPIPNPRDLAELRGLRYDDSTPLQIQFQSVRNGPLAHRLVKHSRVRGLPPEQQAMEPWYLRYLKPDGSRAWLKCGEVHDLAGALAKAILTLAELQRGDATRFARYLGAVQERATLTVGRLAQDWIQLRYPTPDGQPRTTAEQKGIAQYLRIALAWWQDVGLSTITRRTWDDYVAARRAQVAERFAAAAKTTGRPLPSGCRSVDLERNALRCLCAWAMATERITSNPFAAFPRARTPAAIVSCNTQMPASDEEFHLISRHLMGDGSPTTQLVIGAQLLFQGLTGLRPGEPGALRWDARPGTHRHDPGLIHEVTLGGETRRRLAVSREKGGMTPYVAIHPALADFLASWRTYHRAHWPTSPWWFPAPWAPDEQPIVAFGGTAESRLSRYVAVAIEELRLPYRRAHAWRAYYVRVRRSLDISDGQIADELGERTGESIIRSTYGEPDGIRGDGLYDWLPSDGQPAWHLLRTTPEATVIPFRQAV